MMYKRYINLNSVLSRKSLFLLGPRQTGKSTLLKSQYKTALYINLLKNSEYQKYLQNPDRLQEIVTYFIENSSEKLIIIDEIQKIPALLDEVHDLIESNKSLRFILTGSSARKLKRGGANLLGGRASWLNFYPLCFPELGEKKNLPYQRWIERLSIGALPSILDSKNAYADLKDYIGLYIREEVQAEGLSRQIDHFSRFLDFAALMSGEQINYTAIGSDAQISPSTVRDYFEILSDTLIGHQLPAFRETKKRKAMTTSKFYLFDCGVTNCLLGRKEISPGTPEYGKMLEQAIFLELKAYLSYTSSDKKLEYWRSTSLIEVDFIIYENLKKITAIEVKSNTNPSAKDFKGLLALNEDFQLERKIIVCNCNEPRKTKDGIEVLPISVFLTELWAGKIC